MFRLFYNEIKHKFQDAISSAYTVTDSFLVVFKNVNLDVEMTDGRLSHIMDRSNFSLAHSACDTT